MNSHLATINLELFKSSRKLIAKLYKQPANHHEMQHVENLEVCLLAANSSNNKSESNYVDRFDIKVV